MYTVLIAEDELLVRMGIASSVPWGQMNMRVAAEVSDGEAAWEAFQKYRPDVVIADIRMPKLDGMDLLRRIRSVDGDCGVIIVTNVEHGPTLEEARRLGITDVLIKAAMKRDDITAAVLRARESLPEGRGSEALPEANDALWREFLTGSASAEVFRKKCARLNAEYFEPRGFVLMTIRPSERLSHRLKSSLTDMFAHRLSEREDFWTLEIEGDYAAALARKDFDAEGVRITLTAMARYVRDHFGETLCFVLQQSHAAPEQIRSALKNAARYVREEEYFEKSVLCLDEGDMPVFPGLNAAARELRRCIPLSVKGASLARCADNMENLPAMMNAGWHSVSACGMEIMEMLGISAPESFAGMHAMVQALTEAALGIAQGIQSGIRPEIRTALDYIEEHISDELSIRHVSEIAGYHPAYFSSLFKRELGMSYSDFLTGIRIQRAKEMLSKSSRTLQEIADECGFSDISYFSSKFKRVVGITPSQWRAKA